MPYLVDANVLCESSKSHPEPAVLQWLADHDAELHVSVLSLGEMLKGIHLMDQGSRRHDIERWYQRIERWAANRLLSMDASTMTNVGPLLRQTPARGTQTSPHGQPPRRHRPPASPHHRHPQHHRLPRRSAPSKSLVCLKSGYRAKSCCYQQIPAGGFLNIPPLASSFYRAGGILPYVLTQILRANAPLPEPSITGHRSTQGPDFQELRDFALP